MSLQGCSGYWELAQALTASLLKRKWALSMTSQVERDALHFLTDILVEEAE
jgi:hypothetical protein